MFYCITAINTREHNRTVVVANIIFIHYSDFSAMTMKQDVNDKVLKCLH